MKKLSKFAYLLLVCISIGLISCEKDETPEPEPEPTPATVPATTPTPSNPTPSPSDAKGVLVGIKTITFVNVPGVGTIQQAIGVGVASFWETQGTFLDGGAVSVNTKSLVKGTNNVYTFTPTATDVTGIEFTGNSTNWSVAGNSSTGVSAFTYNPNIGFPAIGALTGSPTTVTRASGFKLGSATAITNADSVIFSVYGPSGSKQVVKAGNVSSYSFTASELSGVGEGSGFVQICPYKIASATFTGKKYYFVNESVVTQSVTIN
ncbi:MAG: hypothetical protein WCO37_09085 [Bacteroidota bacterium]